MPSLSRGPCTRAAPPYECPACQHLCELLLCYSPEHRQQTVLTPDLYNTKDLSAKVPQTIPRNSQTNGGVGGRTVPAACL